MSEIQGKHAELSIVRPEALQQIAHALSSPVRLEIMRVLGGKCMNVGEIAAALDLPMSTAALNVKILEEAGIINTQNQPGVRGSMKVCSRRLDTINISLDPPWEQADTCLSMTMPIGCYSIAEDIEPTCGLAGETNVIGEMDYPMSFYEPDRFRAQLIWFRRGFLEYRFAVAKMGMIIPDWLEISFEACSEAPLYRDPWKSDIALEINGIRVGVWTCPSDCGGRRGALTPEWWSDLNTQFGFLKTWRVDATGATLDKEPVSGVTLEQLQLQKNPYISVRIGVPADAANVGGLNLFGEKFGDFAQTLTLRLGYHMP